MPRDDSSPAPPDGKAIIINPSAPLTVAETLLTHLYGDVRRPKLVRHQSMFYRWSGSSWAELGEESLRAEIYTFLAGCSRVKAETPEAVSPNTRLVAEVFSALKAVSLVENIRPPAWFGDHVEGRPRAEEIVVFKNGLLNLASLELIAPTPAFFGFGTPTVEWDASLPEPKCWLGFLNELWPDDPESIDALQQIFGYLLTDSTRLQKAFMLVGPPRSGKGTIGRVLKALVGEENTVAPTLSGLGGHFGRACLIGKRLALIGDAKVGRDTDPVTVAEHLLGISGEDAVTIPRKNLSDWTGHLPIKFVVLCTEVPQMSDDSAGIADRFIILRLVNSFLGREDQGLTARLLAELPSIAVWAVNGWHSLFGHDGSRKIAQPKSGQWDVGDLRNLASDIQQYLDERCEFNREYFVEKDELYKDHCSWLIAQGRKIISKAIFGKKLKAAFPALDHRRPWHGGRDDAGRPRHYGGLKLR
jgi:putative DNA primase/helicase